MRSFEHVLGVEPFEVVDHAVRGAEVARTRVGDCWFVLVCPYEDNSVPGRFLAENGEGFFLLSMGVDNLDAEMERLAKAGVAVQDREPRDGILDWRVADVGDVHGALLQLTDDPGQ